MFRVEQKVTRETVENDEDFLNETVEISKYFFNIRYRYEKSTLKYNVKEKKNLSSSKMGFSS